MSASDDGHLLHQIADQFEQLVKVIEDAIASCAEDDLAALNRAKDAANRGAELARNATSRIGRALD
jgi:hypothetical protein